MLNNCDTLFTLFNASDFFVFLRTALTLHMLAQTQIVTNAEMSSFDFRGKKALSKKKLKRRQKVKSKVKSRTKVSSVLVVARILLLLLLYKMALILWVRKPSVC